MWRERAACRNADTRMFFSDSGGYGKTVKAICAGCPVTSECLTWAFETDDQFAFLGGTNPRDRQKMRASGFTSQADVATWMAANDAVRAATYRTRYRTSP